MTATIAIRGVGKRYVGRGRETVALEPIDLEIEEGELVAFVGPSGCGKSTLMNMIAGIIDPTGGTILHEGRTVHGINRQVGYLTQVDSVLPWRTVEANVGLPLEYRGVPSAERGPRIEAMLKLVNLSGFGKAFPRELSGGMRKRVALAQMLIYEPKTLLMDEPFGALDEIVRDHLNEELLKLWNRTQKTICFVTHSIPEAVYLSTRIVVMSPRPGRVTDVIASTLPRERPLDIRESPEFLEIAHRVREGLRAGHSYE